MSGIWGKNIQLSIFGESHGRAVGMVIHGLPSGLRLDFKRMDRELGRRKPGRDELSTPRREGDEYEIISGFFNGRTTGTPLSLVIGNKDLRSKDYEKLQTKLRPGHGDYPGHMKYKGYQDYRGGGHFSGRLTAPLVLAGAIAKQLLEEKSILIGAHIKSIMDIEDESFHPLHIERSLIEKLTSMEFPVINAQQGERMREVIKEAKEELDSTGGTIQCAIVNVPPGVGEPFFHSIESRLSQMIFSIPGVKGIEFGSGFDITRHKGSQVKDEYIIGEEGIRTLANHNGGILGGISTGMPIIFNTAIKPTSSIGQEQRTVDIKRMEGTSLTIEGRHDPCILPRAVPVVEAAGALVLLDLMLEREKQEWMNYQN